MNSECGVKILGPVDTGRLRLLYFGYRDYKGVIPVLLPLAISPLHLSKAPGTPGPTAPRRDKPLFLGSRPFEFVSVLSLVMEGVPSSTP